ncbi:hypothetical protein [Metabacillus fastidiosus]|uniref:hypothetical protein n=1 Tax=Metabacillus fastidiosus TaxID=1458 RepID=UPI003D2B72A8
MFNLENQIIIRLAVALILLFIVMLFFALIPFIILKLVGVSKKMTKRFVLIFTLIGLLVWVYLIFYLDLFSPNTIWVII